ncbi:hypothetical protein VTO42DRAFT_1648 [Malbranchea cinnamomea]
MTRYLTPSKVALLALVTIYTDGAVPNSAIVPVLSFLVSHLLPLDYSALMKCPKLEGVEKDGDHTVPLKEFEQATAFLPSSIPGRTIWDILLTRLWAFDCFDTLDEFFSGLSDIVVKSREEQIRDRNHGIVSEPGRMRLGRASPLGTFVRRAQLEYTKIRFGDAVQLWRAFISYRMPTYKSWAKRNPSGAQAMVDANLASLGVELESPLARVVYGDLEEGNDIRMSLSAKDIERLLEFQVGQLQSHGCRITDDMKEKLQRMIESGATVSSLSHYIKFLDSWKAGDYPSSFDHLHRYFDYTIQSCDRTFYQYALLNLALLHADFGSPAEAISAIRESISIARETHDMNCLNYCMSWLYHFGQSFPEAASEIQKTGMLGSEKEGLTFLQAKARDAEMWTLLSTSLLSEAKLGLMRGDSIASTFELLAQASSVNNLKNASNATGLQLMMKGGVFGRLGVTHLAWSNYEIFRECYTGESSFEDQLGISCSSAQLLSKTGRYNEAVSQLNAVSPHALRNLKNQQRWVFTMGMIKLERYLHRRDKVAARHLISQLEACAPSDPESSIRLSLSKIELHIKEGDHGTALKLIETIAQSNPQETFDIATQIKLLTLKAGIFAKTNQAERGFSLAMRAASIAHRSRLLTGLWEAVGTLAVILMAFQEFEAAQAILESTIPQVLEGEDCYLAASSYSLLVDANMGMAGQMRHESVRQKEHLARAVEYIDCAFAEYSKVEDLDGQCEMMAKKAMVMHLTGDLPLANDYAAKYLDLKRKAATDRF